MRCYCSGHSAPGASFLSGMSPTTMMSRVLWGLPAPDPTPPGSPFTHCPRQWAIAAFAPRHPLASGSLHILLPAHNCITPFLTSFRSSFRYHWVRVSFTNSLYKIVLHHLLLPLFGLFAFITLPTTSKILMCLLSGLHHKNRNFLKAGTSCLFYSLMSSQPLELCL